MLQFFSTSEGQQLLRASPKQSPLTGHISEPRQRYLTADATAPRLPETKEMKKIGFNFQFIYIHTFHHFYD
jgi:hypothetical protein